MDRKDSSVTLTMITEQRHANIYGTVHGGETMRLMDTAAGCAAIKYAKVACVAVRIDEFLFLKPIHVGCLLTTTGRVVSTGNTSIDIHVTADVENIREGTSYRAIEAFFTYVAIDKEGKPMPVPQYIPETEHEKELYDYVKQRRELELQLHDKMHVKGKEGDR